MSTQPRAWFILDDGYAENQFDIAAMLSDNASDDDLCGWLCAAKVGDTYKTGGAGAGSTLTRIA